MSDPQIHMLGWYLEDTPAGPQVVLVQPYTRPDGTLDNIEHEAASPEELWEAFCAIAEDPGAAPNVEPAPDGEPPRSDLMNLGMSEAEALIGRTVGPTAGRIAGALLRNPAAARSAGQALLSKLRKVSWQDRQPRPPRGGGQ